MNEKEYIFVDGDGNELYRKIKGKGRPITGADEREPGKFYVVVEPDSPFLPGNEIVKIDKEYIFVDKDGNEIERKSKGRGRLVRGAVEREPGKFYVVVGEPTETAQALSVPQKGKKGAGRPPKQTKGSNKAVRVDKGESPLEPKESLSGTLDYEAEDYEESNKVDPCNQPIPKHKLRSFTADTPVNIVELSKCLSKPIRVFEDEGVYTWDGPVVVKTDHGIEQLEYNSIFPRLVMNTNDHTLTIYTTYNFDYPTYIIKNAIE